MAPALINAVPLVGKPEVVRITFSNGWICSGIFLNPTTILTAAHCVSRKDLQITKIESQDNQIVDVRLVDLIPHPKYTGQSWPSFDIGLIKTTEFKEFAGGLKLESSSDKIGTKAMLFGCGKTSTSNSQLARSQGENDFWKIGAVLFFVSSTRQDPKNFGHSVIIAPNDSGGPIISRSTGKIIGVMTTTTLLQSQKYGLPVLGTGTASVSEENMNFLKSNLADFESLL